MATVLLTGGTGMIGTALSKKLVEKGHGVIILTRKAKASTQNIQYRLWDIDKGVIDNDAICKADYIIHLAGENVAAKRWTDKRKQEIVDSRVKSGQLLVEALKKNTNGVKAVISASAIGWYGPDGQVPNPKPFVETDKAHNDFLGSTCLQWEQSIEPVIALGKRLVILRTGIVLSNEGGAYAEFKKPLKAGLATVLGDGKQIVSWIHIDDVVQLYIDAIEAETMQGVYNAVAPAPVSNQALILAIAKQRGKFYVAIHAPAFALKIALGEMSIEVLKSATVSAEKLLSSGYQFLYPQIDDAVKELEASSK